MNRFLVDEHFHGVVRVCTRAKGLADGEARRNFRSHYRRPSNDVVDPYSSSLRKKADFEGIGQTNCETQKSWASNGRRWVPGGFSVDVAQALGLASTR